MRWYIPFEKPNTVLVLYEVQKYQELVPSVRIKERTHARTYKYDRFMASTGMYAYCLPATTRRVVSYVKRRKTCGYGGVFHIFDRVATINNRFTSKAGRGHYIIGRGRDMKNYSRILVPINRVPEVVTPG